MGLDSPDTNTPTPLRDVINNGPINMFKLFYGDSVYHKRTSFPVTSSSERQNNPRAPIFKEHREAFEAIIRSAYSLLYRFNPQG